MQSLIIKNINIVDWEKKAFWAMSFGLLTLAVFYGYFVNRIVLDIVAREGFEKDIAVLNSKVGELEFKYISLKNEIDLDYAHSLGFIDVSNSVKFASRKLPSQNLSLRQ